MSIYQKLHKVQTEVSTVKKASNNPFFNSKYFDINQLLEVVKPVLNKHGLVLMQPLSNIEGQPALLTRLIDSESGEILEDVTPMITINDPQKAGSAITYYRRYALQSLLGLQAEDDDANNASGKAAPVKSAPRKAAKSTF